MSGSKYERELKKILEDMGYIVIRSAGSMGKGDLIVIDEQNYHPARPTILEVKSVKGDTYYTSSTKKNKEQYQNMKQNHDRYKTAFLYAVRYKGLKELHGTSTEEKYRIFNPKNYKIMNINDGLKLDKVFV